MTNRTITVTYTANTAGYESKVERAAKSTEAFAKATDRAESGASRAGSSIGGAGRQVSGTEGVFSRINESMSANADQWDSISNAALVGGGVIGAGVTVAVGKFADFEAAMSEAAFAAGATGGEYEVLKAKAIEMGESSVFSATEAAQAQVELGKAGLSTSDIVGGALAASMDLAAAGGLEMKDAAELTSTTMKTFGLEAKDAGRIADALAGAANASAADVDEMAYALSQVGGVANATGVSMEDTTATLAAFADQGLRGSDAGTSMKTMLQRLAAPTGKAADMMESLGIAAFDTEGNFVGMEALAGQLQTALGGMSEEQRSATLSMIFGSDAMRGANALYATGEEGMKKYGAAVRDQGNAQEMAAAKMDNLKGDTEELMGALETLFITSADGSAGPLRQLVQGVTDAVRWFSGLPEPVKNAAFGIAGVGSAGLLAVGGTMKFASAVKDTASDAKKLWDALRPAKDTIGGAGDAAQGAADKIATVGTSASDAGGKARTAGDGLGAFSTSAGDAGDRASRAVSNVDALGTSVDKTAGMAKTSADSIQGVGGAAEMAATKAYDAGVNVQTFADKTSGAATSADTLKSSTNQARSGVVDLGGAAGTTATQADDLGKKSGKAAGSVDDLGQKSGNAHGNLKAIGTALAAAAAAAVLFEVGSRNAAAEAGALDVATARMKTSLDNAANGGQILKDAFADTGIADAGTDTDLFRDYLDKATASGSTFTGVMMGVGSAFDGAAESIGVDAGALDDFRERMAAAGEAIAATAETDLPKAVEQFRTMSEQMGLSRDEQGRLLETMPALKTALAEQAGAAGQANDDQALLAIALGETVLPAQNAADATAKGAEATKDAATAAGELAGTMPEVTSSLESTSNGWSVMVEGAQDADEAAKRAQASVDEMVESIGNLSGGLMSERDAQRAWLDSLAGVDDAIKENGRTLDVNSEKGRNNAAALDGMVSSLEKYLTAQAEGGASAEQLTTSLETGRQKIIAVARQFGMSKAEAERYADSMGLIPEVVATQIEARGIETGIQGSANYQYELGKIPKQVRTQIEMAGEAQAKAGAEGVSGALGKIDPFKKVQVSAPGATEAAGSVGGVANAVERVPGSKSVNVSAPGAGDATAALGHVTTRAQNIPPVAKVTVSTPGAEAAQAALSKTNAVAIRMTNGEEIDVTTPGWDKAISNLKGVDVAAIRMSNGEEVPVDTPGADASESALERVDRAARNMSDSEHVRVTESGSSGVAGWIDTVARKINALDGRTANVTVTQRLRRIGDTISGPFRDMMGFDTGGYTGDGDRLEEAGVVHRGEFVHTKAHVARPGHRAFHEDLHTTGSVDEAYWRHKRRGYATGGYVGRATTAGAGKTPAGGAGGVTLHLAGNAADADLLAGHIHNAITGIDWSQVADHLSKEWGAVGRRVDYGAFTDATSAGLSYSAKVAGVAYRAALVEAVRSAATAAAEEARKAARSIADEMDFTTPGRRRRRKSSGGTRIPSPKTIEKRRRAAREQYQRDMQKAKGDRKKEAAARERYQRDMAKADRDMKRWRARELKRQAEKKRRGEQRRKARKRPSTPRRGQARKPRRRRPVTRKPRRKTRSTPAGVIHAQRELGRGGARAVHDALRRRQGAGVDYAALSRVLRGYSSGGPVGHRAWPATPPRHTAPAAANAGGGPRVVQHITQYYPQAEPTSRATDRALQYAGPKGI